MSINRGPNIVTDGLVFGYDADDRHRFYKGEPTTNLLLNPKPDSVSNFSKNGGLGSLTFDTNTQSVYWYLTSYEVWGAFINIYPSFTGNLDINSQYTISFKWKSNSNYANSVYNYNLVQGNGVSAAASANILVNSVLQIDGWYLFKYTFIPLNSGIGESYNRIIVGNQNTNVTHFYIKQIQFEKKPHITQFVNGTRSATNALIDLKRATVIDVSNVSFDSTAHPVFNGTDSLIYFGTNNIFNINSNVTVETVCLPNSANLGNIFSASANDGYRIRIENDRQFWLYSTGNTIKGGDLTLGTYHHCVAVFSSTGLRAYINGVLVASNNIPYSPNNNWPYTFIGTANGVVEFFDGKIPILKIYNRALTSQDVQQNYNAYEKRFNI